MARPSDMDDRDRRPDERWPARLVGGRLREARQGRGKTQGDVAREAGLTKSFVSAVERGETSPSIGSLYAICAALGITMSALFESTSPRAGNVVRRAEVRGASFGGEGVVNYILTPHSEPRAQLIETHVSPGGSPGPEPWSHAGELVITTVLQGRLEFHFGDHVTTLEAGDTLTYSPAESHSWGNPDDTAPAVALFFGMPAEY